MTISMIQFAELAKSKARQLGITTIQGEVNLEVHRYFIHVI